MTLTFSNIKSLIDFMRAADISNCEVSTTTCTLTSDLSGSQLHLALMYGATLIDNKPVEQPA